MSIESVLPVLFAADLVLPFLLAPAYKGYSHLTQAMSVLGNKKSPLHFIYNSWLVVFGAALLLFAVRLRSAVGTGSAASALLSFVVAAYAVGGCIASGIFSVGEEKNLETLPAKIHGVCAALGFSLLAFAPLLAAILFFTAARWARGAFSAVCFVLDAGCFALFILSDKPKFRGTAVALEGLWQRLSLLFMYLPVAAVSRMSADL